MNKHLLVAALMAAASRNAGMVGRVIVLDDVHGRVPPMLNKDDIILAGQPDAISLDAKTIVDLKMRERPLADPPLFHRRDGLKGTPPNPNKKTKAQKKAEKRQRQLTRR